MTEDPGWQPLPGRARALFMLTHALGWSVPMVPVIVLATRVFEGVVPTAPIVFASLLLPLFGLWLGWRRHRWTFWRVDDTGFGHRRGRLWQAETRVPRTRVQHVDLKHGPLERRFRLATLVVHTAGTRHSAVAVSGLDADEAARLRDLLAQQVDDEQDDDPPAA